MGPRAVDRATRRAELVSAAARIFAERGVSATSVADIVHAAGVAQGTFYLYFNSKDDVILAVVDGVAEQMLTAFSSILQTSTSAPAQRLRALGRRFADLSQEPSLTDVAEFIHRPENLSLHDRFAEQFLPRLVPLLEELIRDGVADGSFDVPDVTGAAWFILGGLRSIELAGTAMPDLPAALDGAILLALRVLGGGEDR